MLPFLRLEKANAALNQCVLVPSETDGPYPAHSDERGVDIGQDSRSFRSRIKPVVLEALSIIKGIFPYLLIGVGLGTAIHGFVPTGFFEKWITKENPLAVPLAVLLGVPMYANATGVIPILQALVSKGIPLGTALAFSMAVVGLSLPEAALLKKVMKPKLLFWFFGSVSVSIVILGYLFNLIL